MHTETSPKRRPAVEGPLVLIVNPAGVRERGGMGHCIRYLIDAWTHRLHAARIEVLDSRGLGSICFTPFYLAATLLTIAWRRLSDDVALVHVNMADNTSVLRKGIIIWWSKLLGIPVLLHLHAGCFVEFYERLPGVARALTRLIFRMADRTIVLGEMWRRMLIERLGLPASRIVVVYSGVPAALPRAAVPSDKPCRLLYAGRITREKGLVDLFHALGESRLKCRPWTLTLIGQGARAQFRCLARELGIEDRLTFTGWLEREAIDRLFAESDVFVLPSHYEGLPLSVLEALSAKLAVVTTSVGALPEILNDEENALLVPAHDVDALARSLHRLIVDNALCTRLAENGRALYERRYTLARFAAAIETQYAAVARDFSSSRPGWEPSVAREPEIANGSRLLTKVRWLWRCCAFALKRPSVDVIRRLSLTRRHGTPANTRDDIAVTTRGPG